MCLWHLESCEGHEEKERVKQLWLTTGKEKGLANHQALLN